MTKPFDKLKDLPYEYDPNYIPTDPDHKQEWLRRKRKEDMDKAVSEYRKRETTAQHNRMLDPRSIKNR